MKIENFDNKSRFAQPQEQSLCYKMYFGKVEKNDKFEDYITECENKLKKNRIDHVKSVMFMVIRPKTTDFQKEYYSLN